MGAIASLFGGGKKKDESPAPPPATPPVVKPADEGPADGAKRAIRAALIETSPLGDLSPVNTGRKKILGN